MSLARAVESRKASTVRRRALWLHLWVIRDTETDVTSATSQWVRTPLNGR